MVLTTKSYQGVVLPCDRRRREEKKSSQLKASVKPSPMVVVSMITILLSRFILINIWVLTFLMSST